MPKIAHSINLSAAGEAAFGTKQIPPRQNSIVDGVSNLPDNPTCQEEATPTPQAENIPTNSENGIDEAQQDTKLRDGSEEKSQKAPDKVTTGVFCCSHNGLGVNKEVEDANEDSRSKTRIRLSTTSIPDDQSSISSVESLEFTCAACREDARPSKAESKEETIVHQVEYRDNSGNLISTVDWDGPFNFEEARYRKKDKAHDTAHPVLKVLTVLNTSLSSRGPSRKLYETRDLLDEGIIDNPNIAVSIHSRQLVIRSQAFIDVMKSILTYDFGQTLVSGYLRVSEPFSIIVHHLEKLRLHQLDLHEGINQSNTQDGPPTVLEPENSSINVSRKHVEIVLNFVEEELGGSISEELLRHHKSPAMCTFRMLWFLFKPGHTVYVDTDGRMDAYVLESVDMGDAVLSVAPEQLPDCMLKLWHLDFDGRYVTRCRITKWISSFKGEKSILSLNVIPSEFWDKGDGNKLRSQLEDEGAKWYKLLAGKQMQYKGEFVGPRKQSFEGRVYIDPKGYYDLEGPPKLNIVDDDANAGDTESKDKKAVPGCYCDECVEKRHHQRAQPELYSSIRNWKDYDSIDPKTLKTLEIEGAAERSRHRYLICSRNLKGFIFKTRKWETLDVAFCHDTTPNKNPFLRLVMPEDRKFMIESLVYKFTDPQYALNGSQVWGADFIKNKGEGQIFLLHGGPGVGKTFTAECIAEFAGRPLLALTCGDIGTDEVAMEKELGKWLKLAHKWGAVMLLDEADVFLEKRMHSDLKRNSLVSVFLREIEYYQGILFLTTNRVGQFDDAFISRIHVVIHYPDLGEPERRKIWNQFFDKLEEERKSGLKVDNEAKRYISEHICKQKWNGREIRNAFQTAVALAEYRFLTRPNKVDGEIALLQDKDFKQVCDMTVDFKNYLTEVNDGEDEFARAGAGRLRHHVE